MSFLNYLILFIFQVCFSADTDQMPFSSYFSFNSLPKILNHEKAPNSTKNPERESALVFKECIVSKENNTEGLEIDFGILDLKFGADIIDINHLNDEVKKFKTLLDFIMASIAKNDIDEFRLIIDLNDQKVFVNPFRYYVSGYNLQNRRQYLSSSKSLTKKFEDLLKGEKSIFEFLYYTNCNAEESSLENTIWIGGCRSTGLNPFKILIMAFDYETKNSSSSDRKFKKDIMEMWFDWNDAQKNNYCYGIWKAFYDMRLKKCPGFNLKCNRGIKYGNQVEELNHLHVDNPSFRDQFKSLKKELYLNESIFSSEDQ